MQNTKSTTITGMNRKKRGIRQPIRSVAVKG